jgi:hypothetical protein
VGTYSPEARRERISRFVEKRKARVWTKKVKYDVRKNFADSRIRVKVRGERDREIEREREREREREAERERERESGGVMDGKKSSRTHAL